MAKMWQQLIVQIIAFFVVIHHGSQAKIQIAAPENVTVYNKTSHSLFIQWSKVDGHILGYRVRHQRNDTPVVLSNNGSLNNNSSLFVCKNVTAVQIEDLDVYEDYHVEVRAFNNETFGPNRTIAVFRTDEGIPTHPPVNVTTEADQKNATLIAVSWEEVPLGHRRGEISQYLVTAIELEDDGEGERIELNVTGLNTTIQVIYPFTWYNITVAAWTSKGKSNASEMKQVQTAQAAPWNAPTNVSFSYDPYMLNDIFNFTWEPVKKRLNGILRGYQVRWKQVNSGMEPFSQIINETTTSIKRRRRRSTPPIAREIKLKNLSRYSNYSFEVAAITVAVGKYSEKKYFMSQEGVPTAPPGNVKAYNTSSKSIKVSWTRPVDEHIPGVLRGYEITYTLADGAANATRRVMLCRLNTSLHLRPLQVYTLYNITVAAFTIKGIGNRSRLLQVRTSEEAPQAPPENVTAVAVNGSSIRVRWSDVPQDKRNGNITRYTVMYGSRTLNDIANVSRQVRGNSVVIRDLKMFVNYSFWVQAHTTVGSGNFSDPVDQTTNQTVPNVILNLTSSVTNSSMNVTWEVIEKPFGLKSPATYEIKSCPVNNSCENNSCMTKTTSTHWQDFSNLRGNRTYNLSVRPINLIARDGTDLTYPDGNFSEQKGVTTEEGAPTEAPLNVTAKPNTTTSIQITWSEVRECYRNGKIVEYNVEVYNSTFSPIWSGDFNNTTPREAIVGNLEFTNYSVRVRAATNAGNGPFSNWHNTTTHKPAPNFVPQIISATATGNTTINVKWNCTVPSNADYEGYRVRYEPDPKNDPGVEVDREHCEANLTDLDPFTRYSIRVAARTTQDGNYSRRLTITTHEGVPTAAPVVTIEILDSSTVSITWKHIPKNNRKGVILGYHIEYYPKDNKTAVLKENKKHKDFLSALLGSLKKFSRYMIKVSAYTKAGDGPPYNTTFKTGDDVPSAAPLNLTAINSVSPHEINVTWKPVPPEHMNGDLANYQVTYQRVKIGGVPKYYEPVRYSFTSDTSLTLKNLDPYSEYEITVAARTKKGPGPRTLASYGETCHCERSFTTSWRRYEPYVNFTKDSEPGEIIPLVLHSMVRECCGKCQSYDQVELDFKHDGRSNSSERNSNQDLLDNLDESTDFTFPVSGYKEQDSYKGGYGFAPVIESAGVAFVVYPETTQTQNTMFQSLLLCLPVLGLPIITAYIAGVIIWCLERSQNPQEFPPSFLLGTWEGVWWSYVTMTTLGYGDRAPLSPKGRFFAIAWILFGLVIIAVTMAMITTALTSITLESEIKLYGSKVAAEFNSPEYNVGMRRNAKIDPDKPYYSIDEMTEALMNREVEGILVDTYSAGLRGDLFNRPQLRVNQILDYKTAYGVVLGRNAVQLGKCFKRYLTANRAEIFEMIKRKAKPIETSASGEKAEEEASGGLLDSGSPTFLKALKYASVSLGIALVLSLTYECIRCIRKRQKVHRKESHKAKLQEEMQTLVGEFNKRVQQVKMILREKHVKQIIKYWKLQRKSMRETGMEKEWLRISSASPHNGELTVSEI